LSLEEAIAEIEKNLGKQFAPVIGDIFLKSNLNRLWEMLQTGQNSDIYSENINDYGTFAIGALLS